MFSILSAAEVILLLSAPTFYEATSFDSWARKVRGKALAMVGVPSVVEVDAAETGLLEMELLAILRTAPSLSNFARCLITVCVLLSMTSLTS